jgi:hypothetical protein
MRRWVVRTDGPVPTLGDEFVIHYHDSPHRHLALVLGALRQLEGTPHPPFVVR